MRHFQYKSPFTLESGEILPELNIAFHTYGTLNEKRDNCIWVCHALTADSDVRRWWKNTVEKGKFLDPEKYFIVCANILGSCYGTTGPQSINPATGEKWFENFPHITIRDMVKAHSLLADHLRINKIHSLIGSSVGGFQAVEWAVECPEKFRSVILIATDAKASPWTIAVDETQRMAIFSDSSYGKHGRNDAEKGLATARAIGMLTYRGPYGYNLSQKNNETDSNNPFIIHRAITYQRYQGEKLVKRFDAYSYVTILNAFDTHDVGRNREGVEKALKRLSMPVLVVGITSDIIFLPEDMKSLAKKIPLASYKEISSHFGHDGFLVEHSSLNEIITDFYNKIENR